MQKQCTRCRITKPLSAFNRRTASKDGRTAACGDCIRERKQVIYWAHPGERERASKRATKAKQRRFAEEPGYRRAFWLWTATKRRTTIPACATITAFVPICREADEKGAGYVLDHIVPLCHPEVCGLHVPWNLRVVKRETNLKKGNRFITCWNRT